MPFHILELQVPTVNEEAGSGHDPVDENVADDEGALTNFYQQDLSALPCNDETYNSYESEVSTKTVSINP